MGRLPVTGIICLGDRAQVLQRAWLMRRLASFSILAVAGLLAVAR